MVSSGAVPANGVTARLWPYVVQVTGDGTTNIRKPPCSSLSAEAVPENSICHPKHHLHPNTASFGRFEANVSFLLGSVQTAVTPEGGRYSQTNGRPPRRNGMGTAQPASLVDAGSFKQSFKRQAHVLLTPSPSLHDGRERVDEEDAELR